MGTQSLAAVVAANIKRYRTDAGWTQQHLVYELARVGLSWSRPTAADVESPKRRSVSIEELIALAFVFKTSVASLLRTEDPETDIEITSDLSVKSSEMATAVNIGTTSLPRPRAAEVERLRSEIESLRVEAGAARSLQAESGRRAHELAGQMNQKVQECNELEQRLAEEAKDE